MEEKYQKIQTKWLFIWLPCNVKCGFCNAENWYGNKIGFLNLNIEKSSRYKELSVLKSELIGLKKKQYSTIIYEARSYVDFEHIHELLSFWNKMSVGKQRFYYYRIPEKEEKFLDALWFDHQFLRIDFSRKRYKEIREIYGFNVSKFIPLETLKKKLDEYKKENVQCVVYEGGDFSIYPYIFETLEYGFSLWFEQTFQTNGIKLANLEFVEKLKKYWVKDINFSLHSYKEDVSNEIMGIKKGFKETIQAIKNCSSVWMTISQNVVITPDNVNDLDWLILLSLKLKINLISFILFIPPDDKINENDTEYMEKYTANPIEVWKKISKALKYLSEMEKVAGIKLINIKFHNIPLCLLSNDEKGGREYIFDSFRRHASVEDYVPGTWFYKKKECKKCSLNSSCAWITQYYVDIFGEEYIIPIV